jgi:transposase
MMKKTRRKFDRTFKLEVVKRSLSEISVKELSEELGISTPTISRWRREFIDSGEDVSFPGKGRETLTDEQREIKRLTKDLKEKELELEILKKAISIFSKKDRISTNL